MAVETGPIRPPSESRSLLIRLSRNCPWNKCLFCPVYKHEKFSLRKKEDLICEIEYLAALKDRIKQQIDIHGIAALSRNLESIFSEDTIDDVRRIIHWFYHGEFTLFLQDADPLLRKRTEFIELVKFLREKFPELTRITTYSRAATVARFTAEELKSLKAAGLDRVHTGLESGSDQVLALVDKGIRKEDVIEAGLLLREAGIEYSVYVMPGLGGRKLSGDHVKETIDAINRSFPSFVRFRSLALNPSIPLFGLYEKGGFEICSEDEMVHEIGKMIEGITVPLMLCSDHSLNLLMELNGRLPHDRGKLGRTITKYFNMTEDMRIKFIIARRLNEVFELNEFLGFRVSQYIEDLYAKLKDLPAGQRERIFMEMRSQTL